MPGYQRSTTDGPGSSSFVFTTESNGWGRGGVTAARAIRGVVAALAIPIRGYFGKANGLPRIEETASGFRTLRLTLNYPRSGIGNLVGAPCDRPAAHEFDCARSGRYE